MNSNFSEHLIAHYEDCIGSLMMKNSDRLQFQLILGTNLRGRCISTSTKVEILVSIQ